MDQNQIRIADLPTIDVIDVASSYIIVEKPGYQEGTFKMRLIDIQHVLDAINPIESSSAEDPSINSARIAELSERITELNEQLTELSERVARIEDNSV